MRTAPILVALILLAIGACVAQELPEITGKVTLMNGTAYEGVIEVAEFGVKEGAGIGSDSTMSHGYMSVKVDGQEVKVPFADIASAEAKWAPPGPEPQSKWHIETITITRKDGTQVVGAPHWMLFATTARVRLPDGTIARAYAYSSASADFDPGNLLAKVEVGPTAGGGTTAEPTAPTTEPTAPTTEPTAPTTEPTVVEPVITAPPPVTAPILGSPSKLTLTVVCPKCGEKITIEIDVSAKSGE